MGFGIAFLGAALGSMLQNKRDKKAYNAAEAINEKRRSDYYVNLRNAAEKGGFNPLTALRSGGGMGYSSLAGRLTQPLMTRSPLAAGIAAGSNVYQSYARNNLNRMHDIRMQDRRFVHDERMTRLRDSLYRATNLSMIGSMASNDNVMNGMDSTGLVPGVSSFFKPMQSKIGLSKFNVKGQDYVTSSDVKPGWTTTVLSDGTVTPIPGEEVEPAMVLGAEGINWLDKKLDFNGDRNFTYFNEPTITRNVLIPKFLEEIFN